MLSGIRAPPVPIEARCQGLWRIAAGTTMPRSDAYTDGTILANTARVVLVSLRAGRVTSVGGGPPRRQPLTKGYGLDRYSSPGAHCGRFFAQARNSGVVGKSGGRRGGGDRGGSSVGDWVDRCSTLITAMAFNAPKPVKKAMVVTKRLIAIRVR